MVRLEACVFAFLIKDLEFYKKHSILLMISQLSKWIPQELMDQLFHHLSQSSNCNGEECSKEEKPGQFIDLLPTSTTWDGRNYVKKPFVFDSSGIWKFIEEFCNFQREKFNLPVDNIFELSCNSTLSLEEISRFSLPKPQWQKESRSLRKFLSRRQFFPSTTTPASLFQNASFASKYSLLCVTVGHFAPCFCITFDKTEQRIISGSDDGSVKIWCSQTGILIHSLLGHESAVSDVSCSPDNFILASCSLDGTARFWDMKSGRHICHLALDGKSPLQSIQFHPKNNIVCIAASNGFIYLFKYAVSLDSSGSVDELVFKLDSASVVKFLCKTTQRQEIRCCTFSQGGNRIIVGSTDGLIRMFLSDEKTSLISNKDNSLAPPSIVLLDAHEGFVTSVHCSYRGSRFVTGSWDGTARIWSFDREKCKWTSLCLPVYQDGPKFHQNPEKRNRVLLVLWSFDDSKIITSSDDFIIRIWDSFTGRLIHRLVFHEQETYILATHPKIDSIVLSAGLDGKVALWNIETGRIQASFTNEGRKFNDGQFNNDGTLFTLVDTLGSILIFGLGEDLDSFSLAPCEQFFPIDFHRVAFDAMGNPQDSVTHLPLHQNTRIGSLDINGVPNPTRIPLDYGCNFSVKLGEMDSFFENCDFETAFWEEMQIIRREQQYYTYNSTTNYIEQTLKHRKKLKYSFEEVTERESSNEETSNATSESITSQTQLIRDFVNGYDSAQDESYQDEEEEDAIDDRESDSESLSEGGLIDDLSDSDDESYRSSSRPQRRNHRSRTRTNSFSSSSSANGNNNNARRTPSNSTRRRQEPILQPSSWVFSKVPSITPYIPQIGDEIVYFRQGHEAFLALVPERDSMRNLLFSSLPWIQIPNLDPVTFGIVKEISHFVPTANTGSTLISLSICLESGTRMRKSKSSEITVTFYDHDEMTDFIILASHFHAANNKMNLRPNTQVQVLFPNNELFPARIVRRAPFDAEFPSSCWQIYTLVFEDSDSPSEEHFSPWELLKINESIADLPVNSNFTSTFELETKIQQLHLEFPNFAQNVDFSLYPEYLTEIPYPICIQTILERLQNSYYRTWEHFKFECRLITRNAKHFNSPGSNIYREACELGKEFEKLFGDIEATNAREASSSSSNSSQSESSAYSEDEESNNAKLSLRPRKRRRFQIEDDDDDDSE